MEIRMTLEEAIKHCEEKAELKEAEAERMLGAKPLAKRLNRKTFADDSATDAFYNGLAEKCSACAAEHRQLAKWLRELQELRKQPEIIYCKDCDNLKSDEYHHWCKSHSGFFNPEKDFCSRAERRGTE